MKKKLIILDIDETLIYGTKDKLDRIEDFKVFDYYIYLRPFLTEFIEKINEHFKVAIWSSAGENYVKEIAKLIKPNSVDFEFIWSREKAVYQRNFNEISDLHLIAIIIMLNH